MKGAHVGTRILGPGGCFTTTNGLCLDNTSIETLVVEWRVLEKYPLKVLALAKKEMVLRQGQSWESASEDQRRVYLDNAKRTLLEIGFKPKELE